ncbi:hypothetical protein GCM10029992_59990 [Glycomyces albus]
MDLKPANVIVGPDGAAKVIDFTGARYYNPAHLTTIAYTRETAGPEAHEGRVGPAYDVHGFGSIAFFMVTGASARTDSPGHTDSVPWARLRRHPVLESNPRLRDLLTATLDDNPENRPRTEELPGWINELAGTVARSSLPDLGVDWGPAAGGTPRPRSSATGPLASSAARRWPPRSRRRPAAPGSCPRRRSGPRARPGGERPQPIAGRVRVRDHNDYQQGRAGDLQRRRQGGDHPEHDRHHEPESGSGDEPQHPCWDRPGACPRAWSSPSSAACSP